ncbi:putative nuclease HARBI1 [Harpegnathos saltator]|uniref:putative nuclease HARBI1 n=1 Tax=Harpegnathos saltator TaxID=610380 RepID=UPI000948BCD5|nr:putative nuclease HARBI1 [Harpegnathos saltator]
MEYIRVMNDIREVQDVAQLRERTPQVFRDRIDPFGTLNDIEFRNRHRLSKESVRLCVGLVEERLSSQAGHIKNVSPALQVLIALRFYAKGCYQTELGDLHGVSQPTVSRIVAKVAEAIASHLPHFVVCDAQRRILDIVARWRGSAHDSRIWNSSRLKEKFEERRMTGILLGDAGYPCRPYLLTPFLNPRTPTEDRYNRAHIRTRLTIEKIFGEWKGMFRGLRNDMQISLRTAKLAIIAMAVLSNIRKQYDNFEYEPNDEEDDGYNEEEEGPAVSYAAARLGAAFRLDFAQRHFG